MSWRCNSCQLTPLVHGQEKLNASSLISQLGARSVHSSGHKNMVHRQTSTLSRKILWCLHLKCGAAEYFQPKQLIELIDLDELRLKQHLLEAFDESKFVRIAKLLLMELQAMMETILKKYHG